MEKFTKPELLEFLCEGEPDLFSPTGTEDNGINGGSNGGL